MKKFLVLILISILSLGNSVFAKEKIKTINDKAGIYIFKINTKKYGSKIKPYVSQKLQTPKKIYDDNCFDLVVNAGFFDVKTGKSVSYVTIDNKQVENVENNETLVSNLKKQKRLKQVLSRGELRILANKKDKLKFDIARHDDPVKNGYTIKHLLQGGPIIYPTIDLAGEGFVVYSNGMVKQQSADVLKRRERTAIGLKGKYLYIVVFTKDHKVDINELSNYMKKELKIKKALAFDGGLSTAINTKDVSVGSLGKYQRKVKSFLIIER